MTDAEFDKTSSPVVRSDPAPAGVSGPVLDLRILATSDLHANILAWDYHADGPSHTRGLARIATLISGARGEATNSLLLDNGDFLNGSPLGDYVVETWQESPDQPMIAAMNRLGYDAVTLGNHEFSSGVDFLLEGLASARFPVVSCNLWRKGGPGEAPQPLVPPFVLLDRQMVDRSGATHALRIGVIGFLPPQTVIWEQRHLRGEYATADILTTARAEVPRLRALGADLVIALCHSGIGDANWILGSENASLALAGLGGIDAVVAGHTHLVFPLSAAPANADGSLGHTLQGKPAVMPGFFGSHLGVIDLSLCHTGGRWQVIGHHAEVRPIASRDPQTGELAATVASRPEIEALANRPHAALRERAGAVIGHTTAPLISYFSLVAATSAVQLVAEAQVDFLRDVLRNGPHAALPLLSAVAPFKAGGRGGPENYTAIPAGPLTARNAADLYMHPNTLVALRLEGAELALWLERSVSLYCQIAPGTHDAPLIDANFPSFNFDMILGLTYRIDLTQPPRFDARGNEINPGARRIIDLCHNAAPLRPEAEFVLATNSYRSSGGSGFAGTTRDRVIYEQHIPTRDLLERHIAARAAVETTPCPDWWGFAPMPATTAVFDTSPRALAHLPEATGLNIEPIGQLTNGFHRFRLYL